jgi:alanine racemase
MELTTRIIQIKDIQKGDGVGYGWTFRAPRRMKIAILPIGYGDGIPFSTAYVYCNGSRRKILGDISMDQMVIESKGDNMNDIVCLFGNGSSCPQTIYDIEQQSGSTHVEILSHLGHRIRRIYIH